MLVRLELQVPPKQDFNAWKRAGIYCELRPPIPYVLELAESRVEMKGTILDIWQSGKALQNFNYATERSRLDLCWWRDNLLLEFVKVPPKLRNRKLGNKTNFSCAGGWFWSALKTAFRKHPRILPVYPKFQGWTHSSWGRAGTSPGRDKPISFHNPVFRAMSLSRK